MRKLLSAVVLLLGISLAQAKEIPASPSSYVHNDGVMTAEGARVLGAKLAAFEQATGHQFVVAAFQSLDGANLEDYTGQIFKAWKIGDKKRNDGLLLTLFKGDRKWRVQTGYGFEGQITDLQAYNLMTAAAVPLLKKGDIDGGIIAGVDAVIGEIQTASLFGKDKSEGKAAAQPLVMPEPGRIPPTPAPLIDPMLMFWLKVIGGILLLLFLIWLTDGEIIYMLGSISSSSSSSSSGSSSGSSFSGGGGKSGGGGASGGW